MGRLVKSGRIMKAVLRTAFYGLFIILVSCPSPLEDKLTETIETEVKEATAEQYNLTVETPENGIVNLSGSITMKEDIPQQILASPYQTHAFMRWEKVSGSGRVVFDSPESAETSFKVLGGDAVIKAVFEERPYVKYSTPSGNDISRNSKVLIKFSKDMKASLLNSSTVKIIKESDESQVQGTMTYLNHVLTFIPENIWEKYTTYSIQVDKNVEDELGITLRENYISPTTFRTGKAEDSEPPFNCVFNINGTNPLYTNSRNISLTDIDGDDDGSGLSFLYISNDDSQSVNFNQFEFTNNMNWELTDGDGEKTVYIDFEDACYNSLAGVSGGGTPADYTANKTNLITKTITLDTTAPLAAATAEVPAEKGIAFYNTPNNPNNSYTNTTSLNLSIAAEDALVDSGANYDQMEMFISNDVSGIIGQWDPVSEAYLDPLWESYSVTKSWEIEPKEGLRPVVIKFRDSLGNESAKTFDTIKFDETPPTGSVQINTGSLYTNNRAVTLNLSSDDPGVDFGKPQNSKMKISNLSNLSDAPAWIAFNSEPSWNLADSDGEQTVYVLFSDSLGNEMDIDNKCSASITLDRTLPTGTLIEINNGDSETGSSTVNITNISASDTGSGLSEMAFWFENDYTDAEWIPYAATASYAPPSGEWVNGDTMYVYAWFKDNAGNISGSSVNDTITLNTTPPDGSFVINNGSVYTNDTNRYVNINMNLAADGSEYRIANSSSELSSASWIEYGTINQKTYPDWPLTAGDGTKTVYVQFRSSLGIPGPVLSDTIILDTTKPVAGSCYVYGTAADNTTTRNTKNNLYNTVSGSPTQMSFSNDNTNWSGWYSYNTTHPDWDITTNVTTSDGTKTVYFRYKDAAGNISNTVTDTIILDTVAPTCNSFHIAGTSETPDEAINYTNVTLYSNVTDANGVYQMNILNSGETSWNGWESYDADRTGWTLRLPETDGTKKVYCLYKDKAGNTSSSYYDEVELDTQAPSNVSILINNGRKYAYDQNVTLTIDTDDTSTAGYQMRFRYIVGSTYVWTDYEPYSTTENITLSDSDATKYVYVQVMDDAGNTSGIYDHRDTIILDRPSISYVTRGRPGSKGYVKVFLNTVSEDTAAGEDVRYRIYASTNPDDSSPTAGYRNYIYNSGDQVPVIEEETDYYYFVRIGHFYNGSWHNLNTFYTGPGGSDKSGFAADVVIIYDDGDTTDYNLAVNLRNNIIKRNFPSYYSSWASGTQPDWSVKILKDTEISETYSSSNIVYGKPAIITPGLTYSYTNSGRDGWVRNIAAAEQGIITMGNGCWVLDRIEDNFTSWGLSGQAPTDIGDGESATFPDSSKMDYAKVCSTNTIWRTPVSSTYVGTNPSEGTVKSIFTTDSNGKAVHRSGGANPAGGYNYAQINDTETYYSVVRQGRFMFWGWNKIPNQLSSGQMMFVNSVAIMDNY